MPWQSSCCWDTVSFVQETRLGSFQASAICLAAPEITGWRPPMPHQQPLERREKKAAHHRSEAPKSPERKIHYRASSLLDHHPGCAEPGAVLISFAHNIAALLGDQMCFARTCRTRQQARKPTQLNCRSDVISARLQPFVFVGLAHSLGGSIFGLCPDGNFG